MSADRHRLERDRALCFHFGNRPQLELVHGPLPVLAGGKMEVMQAGGVRLKRQHRGSKSSPVIHPGELDRLRSLHFRTDGQPSSDLLGLEREHRRLPVVFRSAFHGPSRIDFGLTFQFQVRNFNPVDFDRCFVELTISQRGKIQSQLDDLFFVVPKRIDVHDIPLIGVGSRPLTGLVLRKTSVGAFGRVGKEQFASALQQRAVLNHTQPGTKHIPFVGRDIQIRNDQERVAPRYGRSQNSVANHGILQAVESAPALTISILIERPLLDRLDFLGRCRDPGAALDHQSRDNDATH